MRPGPSFAKLMVGSYLTATLATEVPLLLALQRPVQCGSAQHLPGLTISCFTKSADHAYGCKSPTLEVIALILPFLTIPHLIYGTDILLLTDNMSVVYGWESRKIRNDTSASIFIKTLHILSFYLGCNISVQHLPRQSTAGTVLADALSRQKTTTREVQDAVSTALQPPVPTILMEWLHRPVEDWALPLRILHYVQSIIPL